MLTVVGACGRIDFDPRSDGALDAAGCQHTFCDAFDDSGALGATWTSISDPDDILSLDETTGVSPPASFHVAFPPTVDAMDSLEVALGPTAITSVRYAFDYELVTTDSTAEIDLAQLHWLTLPSACTDLGFFIVRTRALMPPALVMQETYTGCGGNIDDPLPTTAGFHHFEITVTLGTAGNARIGVLVDGVTAVDRAIPVDVPSSLVTFSLGAPHIQDAEQAWDMHYDNVAIDVD